MVSFVKDNASLNTVYDEISHSLVFSGCTLQRLSETRSPDCVAKALANPQTRIMGFLENNLVLKRQEGHLQASLSVDDLNYFTVCEDKVFMLGTRFAPEEQDAEEGIAFLAVALKAKHPVETLVPNQNMGQNSAQKPIQEKISKDGFYQQDLRTLARQGGFSDFEYGVMAYGFSLLHWHKSNGFCGQCGAKTQVQAGGASRYCLACEKEHFPRTDPVVIMLVVDGERCLLGRSPHFPKGIYSALAGFVEQGETLEMAVRRETFEESGIHLGRVVYHASQPWPFPHSVMIGCYGEALDDKIVKDDEELEDCRWFTRTEIRHLLQGKGEKDAEGNPLIMMPASMAIAHRLIADWAFSRVF